LTSEGRAVVEKFDQELIDRGLNPGTTADFTASSIMVSYLDGYHDYKTKLEINKRVFWLKFPGMRILK
jgi:triphosphoribosyl-dephospho-CoA synthase